MSEESVLWQIGHPQWTGTILTDRNRVIIEASAKLKEWEGKTLDELTRHFGGAIAKRRILRGVGGILKKPDAPRQPVLPTPPIKCPDQ